MNIKNILAENIRFFRKKSNFTQEKLADESGLHRTYIDSIENKHRNVSIENIDAIAKALSIKTFELLKEQKGVKYD